MEEEGKRGAPPKGNQERDGQGRPRETVGTFREESPAREISGERWDHVEIFLANRPIPAAVNSPRNF